MFDHRKSLQNESYFLQNGYSIFEFLSTLFFYLKDPSDIDPSDIKIKGWVYIVNLVIQKSL